jgi:hypothetical protein
MNIEWLTPWITAVASGTALIVGVLTALWAYAKFVVERGLLPPAQFWIECNPLGSQQRMTLLEFVLHVENRGSSALVATNIRLDLRYIDDDEVPGLVYLDGTETDQEERRKRAQFGRLSFPRSLRRELESRKGVIEPQATAMSSSGPEPQSGRRDPQKAHRTMNSGNAKRGFAVMPHDTFIQSGIDQRYTFTTAVPSSAGYVLAWASFEYAQRPVRVQQVILWICRRLGLVQFTLQHVAEPHTAERVFKL